MYQQYGELRRNLRLTEIGALAWEQSQVKLWSLMQEPNMFRTTVVLARQNPFSRAFSRYKVIVDPHVGHFPPL